MQEYERRDVHMAAVRKTSEDNRKKVIEDSRKELERLLAFLSSGTAENFTSRGAVCVTILSQILCVTTLSLKFHG
jgi:hypothetical protein